MAAWSSRTQEGRGDEVMRWFSLPLPGIKENPAARWLRTHRKERTKSGPLLVGIAPAVSGSWVRPYLIQESVGGCQRVVSRFSRRFLTRPHP